MAYPDSAVGRRLGGRYMLTAIRYKLAYGVVFDALDERYGRQVSVLVFFTLPKPEPSFAKHARLIGRMYGPHLNGVIGSLRLPNGIGGLVMGSYDGCGLSQFIVGGAPTLSETLSIFESLLKSLDYIHNHGHLHLDLRPETIHILSSETEGAATAQVHCGGVQQLLRRSIPGLSGGATFGHPMFLAPEQWVNRRVDARADLYAVGLIGYVLLNGRHFIPAGAPLEVCQAHFTMPRPAIEATTRGEPIPDALMELLESLTQPERSRRPSTAAEALERLEDVWSAMPSRPVRPMPQVPPSTPPVSLQTSPVKPVDFEDVAVDLDILFED